MPRPFRFGVVTAGAPTRAAWVDLARRAEDLGYSSLLMPDRNMTPLAPLTALAVAAAATTTLHVGSYVFCNDYRHPAVLAREAATLDLLSEGRFELGLGAGVGPSDYRQLGLPFESPGTRVGRVEEAVQIIKRFFTEDTVTFAGKYYTVTDMRGQPKPVRRPHPPILIGSGSRRMLSLAGREADCVGPAMPRGPQGADPAEVPLEAKIEWVRAAAGARFADLDLMESAFTLVLAEGPPAAPPPVGGPPVAQRKLSTDEAVAGLQDRRARYGFSYIQVFEGQMENFAPVVARLAGQ